MSDAFESAVVAAMPMLQRRALALTRDHTRAEDLVSETIVRALAKRHQFEPGSNLDAWLLTILRNEFHSRWRKTRREVEDVDDMIATTVADESAEDDDSKDDIQALRGLLEALDPTTKAMLLDLAGGASYAEIAAKYQLSDGTVKSRISRARAVLLAGRNGQVVEAEKMADTGLQPILTPVFATQISPPQDLGPPPILRWIPVDLLRVDPSFQREILKSGKSNVGKIASAFDWNKFGTVIVAAVEEGFFSIIDGQHRTTAAKLCGIAEVPCQVITASREEQASAFAAINGNVTALTSMQIHHARVAAREPLALELERVCKEAGVTILRYPVPASIIKPGQTLAVGALYACLRRFGAEILGAALLCLTRTRGGNPGLYRAQLIQALCMVLARVPRLSADPLPWARSVQFSRIFNDATVKARTSRSSLAPVLANDLLETTVREVA